MDCRPTFLSILTAVSASSYAVPAHSQSSSEPETSKLPAAQSEAVNVSFPGIPAGLPMTRAPVPAIKAPAAQLQELRIPQAPISPLPLAPAPQNNPDKTLPQSTAKMQGQKLMVSRMQGEVHLKHIQGPKLDPARALRILTGTGNCWCEIKMQDLTGRVWADSELSVFPDNGLLLLEKGALITRLAAGSEQKVRVMAGDYVCRLEHGSLRLQKTGNNISFQVLEGEATVFNRKTGEIYQAVHVLRPAK